MRSENKVDLYYVKGIRTKNQKTRTKEQEPKIRNPNIEIRRGKFERRNLRQTSHVNWGSFRISCFSYSYSDLMNGTDIVVRFDFLALRFHFGPSRMTRTAS